LFSSYLNPANRLNITPEIVDRLFNADQRDLPRKVDFVNEVERWKIRFALVDDKPERLLDTLHATNRDLYTVIYSITMNTNSESNLYHTCILLSLSTSEFRRV